MAREEIKRVVNQILNAKYLIDKILTDEKIEELKEKFYLDKLDSDIIKLVKTKLLTIYNNNYLNLKVLYIPNRSDLESEFVNGDITIQKFESSEQYNEVLYNLTKYCLDETRYSLVAQCSNPSELFHHFNLENWFAFLCNYEMNDIKRIKELDRVFERTNWIITENLHSYYSPVDFSEVDNSIKEKLLQRGFYIETMIGNYINVDSLRSKGLSLDDPDEIVNGTQVNSDIVADRVLGFFDGDYNEVEYCNEADFLVSDYFEDLSDLYEELYISLYSE